MEQRRSPKAPQPTERPHARNVDLTLEDDDFYDLPPYEPHVPTPKAPKPPKAPKQPKVKAPRSSEDSAKIMLTISRVLMTLALACLITAVVVGIAHSGILPPDASPDTDSEQPPNTDTEQPPDTDSPDQGDVSAPTPPFPVESYAVDVSAYLTAIEYAPDKEDVLLLNKEHPVGEGFKPSTLITLPVGYTYGGKTIQLDATAAIALQAMMLCMRADGITDTYVTSGYRSYSYQLSTFENHVQKELQKNQDLTREEAARIAETYSARAGYSEHQSGLCVDFMTIHMTDLVNEQFEPTAAYAWLQENAAEFGFILRYPKNKTDVTGYSYESWHYRFVGRAAALEITSQDITLEEYLEQSN